MQQRIQSILIRIVLFSMMFLIVKATIAYILGLRKLQWIPVRSIPELTTVIYILNQSQITAQVSWTLVSQTVYLRCPLCPVVERANCTISVTAKRGWYLAPHRRLSSENTIQPISIWARECVSLIFVSPTILHCSDDHVWWMFNI